MRLAAAVTRMRIFRVLLHVEDMATTTFEERSKRALKGDRGDDDEGIEAPEPSVNYDNESAMLREVLRQLGELKRSAERAERREELCSAVDGRRGSPVSPKCDVRSSPTPPVRFAGGSADGPDARRGEQQEHQQQAV